MKQYTFILLLLTALFVLNNDIQAQNDDKKYNETVIVTSTFNPIVSEAKKIDENGTVLETDIKKEKLNIQPLNKPFHTYVPVETIKPANVKGEPLEMLYNTHIAAGIGTYFTPYLDVTYSQTRSRTFIYSAHARHYSSLWAKMKDVAHSAFADNDIDLYAKRIWNNCFIDGSFFYSYDRNYWYGFNPDNYNTDFAISDYRLDWQNVGFRINYGSLYRENNKLNHSAKLDFQYTTSRFGISELGFVIGASANKNFNFWTGDIQTLGLNIDYKLKIYGNEYDMLPYYTSFSMPVPLPSSKNIDNGKLTINPYFDFSLPQVKKLKIHTGFFVIPTFENETKVFLLPQVYAFYPVIDNLLHVKAGVIGALLRRSLNPAKIENPYISPFVLLKGEKLITTFIQINSNPQASVSMQLNLGIDFFENKGFFTLDPLAGLHNMFILTYDNGKRYYTKYQLSYSILSNLNLNFDAQLQSFEMKTLKHAWYQPVFSTHLQMEYIIAKKLRLQFTPSFYTSNKALNENNEIKTLKPRISIDCAAQYDMNKQLSFFINLNNLAFQRQYQYIYYPSQRFMGMIGAKLAL
ncbi:MAG: hypothetical protein LBR28_03520 [Bacteroidales bacterium]|jgi:hypothetical protein|nr:hypothetical protein [Bacteroidales bacterium]